MKPSTWNGQSRNMSIPGINEEHLTQVFKQNENRVTEKLSQQLSRTESRFLGALSKFYDSFLNSQIRTHSRTLPRTSWNTEVEKQEPIAIVLRIESDNVDEFA